MTRYILNEDSFWGSFVSAVKSKAADMVGIDKNVALGKKMMATYKKYCDKNGLNPYATNTFHNFAADIFEGSDKFITTWVDHFDNHIAGGNPMPDKSADDTEHIDLDMDTTNFNDSDNTEDSDIAEAPKDKPKSFADRRAEQLALARSQWEPYLNKTLHARNPLNPNDTYPMNSRGNKNTDGMVIIVTVKNANKLRQLLKTPNGIFNSIPELYDSGILDSCSAAKSRQILKALSIDELEKSLESAKQLLGCNYDEKSRRLFIAKVRDQSLEFTGITTFVDKTKKGTNESTKTGVSNQLLLESDARRLEAFFIELARQSLTTGVAKNSAKQSLRQRDEPLMTGEEKGYIPDRGSVATSVSKVSFTKRELGIVKTLNAKKTSLDNLIVVRGGNKYGIDDNDATELAKRLLRNSITKIKEI